MHISYQAIFMNFPLPEPAPLPLALGFRRTLLIIIILLLNIDCIFGSEEISVITDQQISARPRMNNMKGKTTWYDQHQKFQNMPFIEGDFICWSINQQGNTFASTGTASTVSVPSNALSTLTSGQIYAPQSVMEPGFKLAIGMNLEYDFWNWMVTYTWIQAQQTSSVSSLSTNSSNGGIVPIFNYAPSNGILTTIAINGGNSGFISTASAQWHLRHLNIFDIYIGKYLYFSSTFLLHPYLGIKATYQKQVLDIAYYVNSLSNASQELGQNKVHFQQHQWGMGPRFGIANFLKCVPHFDVFTNLAITSLYSSFYVISKSFDTNATVPSNNIEICYQENNVYQLIPILELSLGVSTEWLFTTGACIVGSVAWENQLWWYMNQHSSSIADLLLNMQGITASIHYDF